MSGMPTTRHESTPGLVDSTTITKVSRLSRQFLLDSPLSSWLYRVFLAIDANFRLKRKNVSSDSADPAMGDGWAYFVEEQPYKEYLSKRIGEAQEVRVF